MEFDWNSLILLSTFTDRNFFRLSISVFDIISYSMCVTYLQQVNDIYFLLKYEKQFLYCFSIGIYFQT